MENASQERRAEVRKRLASPEKATSEPFIPPAQRFFRSAASQPLVATLLRDAATGKLKGDAYNDRFYKIFVPAPPDGKDASLAANAFNYPGEHNSLEMDAAWLPDGVRSIGAEAFYECYNLESVQLPNDLESIGDSAFFSCNLTTISFPNGLRSIGSDAFYRCKFTTVALPDALETLAASAFSGCKSLATTTLPVGVETLGGGEFDGCEALTSIEVDPENPNFSGVLKLIPTAGRAPVGR